MTVIAPVQETLPHWDLSNVYPSLELPEFLAAVDDLGQKLDGLEHFMDAHQVGRGHAPAEPKEMEAVMSGYLQRTNALLIVSGTLGAYVRAIVATDSYHSAARHWLSRLEQLGVRLRQPDHALRRLAGRQRRRAAGRAGRSQARRGAHAFYLTETAEQSRYLMSGARRIAGRRAVAERRRRLDQAARHRDLPAQRAASSATASEETAARHRAAEPGLARPRRRRCAAAPTRPSWPPGSRCASRWPPA